DPRLPFGWGRPGFKLRGEAVAALGDRFDVPRGRRVISDGAPDLFNCAGQGVIGDERVLPDLLEQLLLFNDSAPILDQVDQQIERSGLQRLRLIALQDPEVLQIHYYVIEIIAGRVRPSGRLHRSNSSGSFGFLPGHRKITVSSELHHYRRDEFDYSR